MKVVVRKMEIKIKDIDEFKEFVWKSVHEYDESTKIDIRKCFYL